VPSALFCDHRLRHRQPWGPRIGFSGAWLGHYRPFPGGSATFIACRSGRSLYSASVLEFIPAIVAVGPRLLRARARSACTQVPFTPGSLALAMGSDYSRRRVVSRLLCACSIRSFRSRRRDQAIWVILLALMIALVTLASSRDFDRVFVSLLFFSRMGHSR